MKRTRWLGPVLVTLSLMTTATGATTLRDLCADWNTEHGESHNCQVYSGVPDELGILVEVIEGTTGCSFPDAELKVDNTHADDVAVKVRWFGQATVTDNLHFKNRTPGPSSCQSSNSGCSGANITGGCLGATCPDGGCDDTGDCQFVSSCSKCECEIEAESMVVILADEVADRGCALPSCYETSNCTGATCESGPSCSQNCADGCDNTVQNCSSQQDLFCVEIQPGARSNGVGVQIQEISFDNGTQWTSLSPWFTIPDDDETITSECD